MKSILGQQEVVLPRGGSSMRIEAIDEQFLLTLKDGTQSRSRILSLLGLSDSAFWRHRQKLEKYGLIKQPRYKYYALTKQGKAFVEQLSVTVTPRVHKSLDQIISLLPTLPHQAFFRLLLSGVVAKKHLLAHFDSSYPAFFACGRTATFKTSLATLVCKVFGLDSVTYIYLITLALPKELGIRRVREKGKQGFDISTSPYLEQPFICFDELDKASTELRKVALAYADGRREFLGEGQAVTNHVCAMMTLNKELDKLPIPDAYLRRSIVLDTDPLAPELTDVDLIAKQIFESRIPRIDLESCMVRVTTLSGEEYALLRDLLKRAVKPEAWGVKMDTQPVVILTLGRLILTGSSDVKEAIYSTVYDRLWCLETIGGTVEGWQEAFREEWSRYQGERRPELEQERIELMQKAGARSRKLKEREGEIRAETKQKILVDLEFVKGQEGLVQTVLSWKRVEPFNLRSGEWVAKTKAIKKELDTLAGKIKRIKQGDRDQLSMFEEIARQTKAKEIDSVIQQYQSYKAYQERQEEAQRKQEDAARLARKQQESLEKKRRREAARRRHELTAIEREEEQLQKELRDLDAKKGLTSSEEKAFIKRLEYYLGRKAVKTGEDIGSVLQNLGLVTRISVSDIERRMPEFTLVKLAGEILGRSFNLPEYALEGIDTCLYPLDYFTDWEKGRPLLKMKKQQILAAAQQRYVQRCNQRLAELRSRKNALLGVKGFSI